MTLNSEILNIHHRFTRKISHNGVFLFLKSPSKSLNACTNVKKKIEAKIIQCAFIKVRASLGIIDSIWWKHTPSNVMAFRNGWKVSYFDGNSISRFLMKPDLCLRSMYISVTSVVEFWGQDSTGSRFLLKNKRSTFQILWKDDCYPDFLSLKLKSSDLHTWPDLKNIFILRVQNGNLVKTNIFW